MIRAIIIDDEPGSLQALKLSLGKFCPQVDVLGCYEIPEEGLAAIRSIQPDLLFLDVQMPSMTGFDLLEELEQIDFEIIFVTAYDQYAIKAIKFSALDYLMKPVDVDELTAAISKVENRQDLKMQVHQYRSVIANLKSYANGLGKIAIPSMEGIIFLEIKDIVYGQAEGNYTNLFLQDKETLVVTKSLKDFETLLDQQGFFRVHHSYLINLNHIQKYVKGEGGYVELTGGSKVDISRRKKEEFLKALELI
ncbi:MAG: LytR/AlgR family response regulator transcription factor [Cyclobacteriaceae bacterium]